MALKMPKDKTHLENINTREFYEFYKRNRRKQSKKIDQHNYFIKAIHGFLLEVKKCLEESNHGVYLKGLGVIYKKPHGIMPVKQSIFTIKKVPREQPQLLLEDEYLRHKYIIRNVIKKRITQPKLRKEKPNAIILHRKLIKKDAISNT